MSYDMVNHPPHYERGPRVVASSLSHEIGSGNFIAATRVLECIEVIRYITDIRLANAVKYIWRVAFGGKENDRQDIEKAIWYLRDWLDNEVAK